MSVKLMLTLLGNKIILINVWIFPIRSVVIPIGVSLLLSWIKAMLTGIKIVLIGSKLDLIEMDRINKSKSKKATKIILRGFSR
ncbi:MAG TPA: hypothetical protein VN040_07175 [Pseudosphingobacterium sp.]|nr:hypothetical protein [Pseudosphingobacterium sp.]